MTTATTKNAPSLSGNSAEGNDQTPGKEPIMDDATSVPLTTDTAVIDARFAGGPIFVDRGTLHDDDPRPVVIVTGPGFEFPMFPHEAEALARALTMQAHNADRRRPLKRSPEVDDHLRELDD